MKPSLEDIMGERDERRRAVVSTLSQLRQRLSLPHLTNELFQTAGLTDVTKALPQAVRQRPVVFAGMMMAALYLAKSLSRQSVPTGGTPSKRQDAKQRKSHAMTKGGHHGRDNFDRIHQQDQDAGAQG